LDNKQKAFKTKYAKKRIPTLQRVGFSMIKEASMIYCGYVVLSAFKAAKRREKEMETEQNTEV
jgi:hypothetical protein